MRKIHKTTKPRILIDNADNWTKEYCDYLSSGREPSQTVKRRYAHPEIKEALVKETFGKCAYCESKMLHISYGDIEHILPKNKDARPDLYVEWNNLTLACERCNRSGKHDYYNPDLPLINPYEDNPDDYFLDIGPMVMPILGEDRAFITEKKLNLNRADLIERRTERIQGIENLLHEWVKESNGPIKDVLACQLIQECNEDKEYSSTVKAFLLVNGFPYSKYEKYIS